MKHIIITIIFLVFPFAVFAQKVPDTLEWIKNSEAKIKQRAEETQKRKPEFAADLQFSKPDYTVFIPEGQLDKLADTYNDHFQVFDAPNGMYFAVWCQATYEAAPDQHVAFSRSKDKGKTWEKPQVLAGNANLSESVKSKGAIASWAFPLVSKSGRIYILYNQYVPGTPAGTLAMAGKMMGRFSEDNGETWSKAEEVGTPVPRTIYDSEDENVPPDWIVWQKPLRLGKNGTYLVGCSRYANPNRKQEARTLTTFIHFENVDMNPLVKDLAVKWSALNDKSLHVGTFCEEPSIVKLPDGRLFCVMRTGTGSPCWTQSKDDGETWTQPKILLIKDGGDPIPHPMSPCPIYDWKGNEAASGFYFLMAHNRYEKWNPNPWQNRGPLYLFAGHYKKDAEQPVWFDGPKKFIERKSGNSFYTSTTQVDGKTVLWYNDKKFYLLGRVIGEDFFDGKPDAELYKPADAPEVPDLSAYTLRNNADGKPLRLGTSPKLELKDGAEQGTFKPGAKIFTNRNYSVIQQPKELNGKNFIRSKIESAEIVCKESGMIYVLTPMKDRNRDSMTEELLKLGFEKVAQAETLLYQLHPDSIVTLYQKEIQPGETLKLKQWSVIVY